MYSSTCSLSLEKSLNQSISTETYEALLNLIYPTKPNGYTIHMFFYAIWKNNIDDVREFIRIWKELPRHPIPHYTPYDEAGLDLALRFGHYNIVNFLKERLDLDYYFMDMRRSLHRQSNFIDFLLYKAVIVFHPKLIRLLLKNGANPNSYYDNQSILDLIIVSSNVLACKEIVIKKTYDKRIFDFSNVSYFVRFSDWSWNFDEDEKILTPVKVVKYNLKKLYDALAIFLEYGAEPFCKRQNLLKFIILLDNTFHEPHLLSDFYLKIIRLLPVSKKAYKIMQTPPRFAQPMIADAVLHVNQQMQIYLNKRRYIEGLKTGRSREGKNFVEFYLKKNNAVISIETRRIDELSAAEENLLVQYFVQKSHIQIKGKSKEEYIKDEMKAKSGVTFVDIIRNRNAILGIYIYEYINTNLNNTPTFIHYSKLAVADINEDCPDLIKLIILIRGFACTLSGYTSITFAEIASRFGFALADIMKCDPKYVIPKINMKDILNIVKGMQLDPGENGCYYIKDNMSVENCLRQNTENPNVAVHSKKSKNKSALVTLSILSQKSFISEYYREGHSLCLAFLNNIENFEQLKNNITILGGEDFSKLFSYYAKSVNEFILNSANNVCAPIRSKL